MQTDTSSRRFFSELQGQTILLGAAFVAAIVVLVRREIAARRKDGSPPTEWFLMLLTFGLGWLVALHTTLRKHAAATAADSKIIDGGKLFTGNSKK